MTLVRLYSRTEKLCTKAKTCFLPYTGNPQPKITWLKDGHPLPSGDNFSISPDGSKLHIPQASLSDAGRYSCMASSSVANQTKHYLLDVFGTRCLWMEADSQVGAGDVDLEGFLIACPR